MTKKNDPAARQKNGQLSKRLKESIARVFGPQVREEMRIILTGETAAAKNIPKGMRVVDYNAMREFMACSSVVLDLPKFADEVSWKNDQKPGDWLVQCRIGKKWVTELSFSTRRIAREQRDIWIEQDGWRRRFVNKPATRIIHRTET